MEIVIPEYKIERRVRSMAHKISEEHKSSGNNLPPVMICVLNGAFMFFSDLVKDMGIDVAALVRYLYQSRFIIVAIAMLPIAGYLLFAAMQQKDHNDNLIASIVKINQRLENFNPNAIISEDIVAEALRQNAIEVTPAELVPLLNVVVGFERLNDPIDAALAKLAGEVSVGRGEDPDDIQARYDNLIASQNNFLTIYFNMEK